MSLRAAGSPRLLFLPGMMCDERLFAYQARALGASDAVLHARLDGHDSIEALAAAALAAAALAAAALKAVELAAASLSTAAPATTSSATTAPSPRDAHTGDDAAGGDRTPPGPLVLVGLSMGGIVAMECLRQAPDRIAGLALLDTNHLAEAPERQRLRVPQIERALAGELDAVLVDEMKPLYLAPAHRDDEALLTLVLAMARDLGPDVFARQSRALATRRDYSDVLAAWTGPTLLLCGEHDGLCPPARHRAMQALMPQASLEVIADAGHLPTLEAPAATNRALVRFVESL